MDEAQWVPESEAAAFLANHPAWELGAVDHQRKVVWVTPPGWVPPPPDLNKPWPRRPDSEVPRASYRSDGTVRTAGYLPSGKKVEAEGPLVQTCPLCGGKGTLGGAA